VALSLIKQRSRRMEKVLERNGCITIIGRE